MHQISLAVVMLFLIVTAAVAATEPRPDPAVASQNHRCEDNVGTADVVALSLPFRSRLGRKRLTRAMLLQAASTAMLTTSNTMRQLALSLLK